MTAFLFGILLAACGDGSSTVELPVYEVWIGDDDLTVYALVGHGSCDEVGDLALEETDSEVAVGVQAQRPSDECPAEEIVDELRAVLDRPLGDREFEAFPATKDD